MNKPAHDARRLRIAALGYDFAAQPKCRHERCNFCSGTGFVTISHVDRYGYPARADACSRCGLVFLNPVMTPSAYARFYVDIYRPLVSAFHGREINAQTIQSEQADYAAELATFLAPDLDRGGFKTMLDIGGSTGVVAHHLAQRFGLSGTVIDPAPLEIDVARRLGLETLTGFIEDYDAGADRFDFVMMCQTIDHLLDIYNALRKIREIIRPNGLFFADIVDFRAAYLRNHSVEAAIKIDHPYYLTEPTMEAYFRRSGFVVHRKTYSSDHLHVGFLCGPAAPDPDFLPEEAETRMLLREIRWVQNTRMAQA